MEGLSYNVLGNKNKIGKPFLNAGVEYDLASLFKENQDKIDLLEKGEVLKAFCNSLKNLLDITDLKSLISGLFEIEYTLNSIKENGAIESDMPCFAGFYNSLSPILLRAVLEHDLDNEDSGTLIKGWLEALRIALEEELYVWQEKII